jgi:hypothetical protein
VKIKAFRKFIFSGIFVKHFFAEFWGMEKGSAEIK